jgi:NAD(P)-dependent dehydrogenase (short-subunit alcohol dehydrogenase family)
VFTTKLVALVTGANQGIGLQIAKDLVAHGSPKFSIATNERFKNIVFQTIFKESKSESPL